MRIGIDLGGSKIEIIALGADSEELLRRRVPTPQGDYPGTVMAVAALVEQAELALNCRCTVGIGIPGALSGVSGHVKNANSTCLIGQPLQRDHFSVTGNMLTPPDIVAHAMAGDLSCAATLQRYEARLARGLAQVINILDPDVIVLGGGLSNIQRLYDNVPRLWGKHVFSDQVLTRLLRNRHGDSSGVRGAAWLWEKPA